jgi:hypothetical protein
MFVAVVDEHISAIDLFHSLHRRGRGIVEVQRVYN